MIGPGTVSRAGQVVCYGEVQEAVPFGLDDNESFARIDSESLAEKSREVLSAGPDALIFLCTNLYGAPVVEQLEDEFGIPVIDSVVATLWKTLKLAGAAPVDKSWGRMLAK